MGGRHLRIKGIGLGLLAAAGSVLMAGSALAGSSTLRLNGSFGLQDESAGTDNLACVVASFTTFQVFGLVAGTTGACTVGISYNAFAPTKTSASVLKDDGSGSAKVAQQVETFLAVTISGAECTTAPYSGEVQPEKCKTSASVNASEPSESVDKGKVSVSCEVGSDGSQLVPSPTVEQLETIGAAFADRSDVKITSNGKVTIKTKGEAGPGC
jgi:hypothetical protein